MGNHSYGTNNREGGGDSPELGYHLQIEGRLKQMMDNISTLLIKISIPSLRSWRNIGIAVSRKFG